MLVAAIHIFRLSILSARVRLRYGASNGTVSHRGVTMRCRANQAAMVLAAAVIFSSAAVGMSGSGLATSNPATAEVIPDCPCLANGGQPGPGNCPCDVGQCYFKCVAQLCPDFPQ